MNASLIFAVSINVLFQSYIAKANPILVLNPYLRPYHPVRRFYLVILQKLSFLMLQLLWLNHSKVPHRIVTPHHLTTTFVRDLEIALHLIQHSGPTLILIHIIILIPHPDIHFLRLVVSIWTRVYKLTPHTAGILVNISSIFKQVRPQSIFSFACLFFSQL